MIRIRITTIETKNLMTLIKFHGFYKTRQEAIEYLYNKIDRMISACKETEQHYLYISCSDSTFLFQTTEISYIYEIIDVQGD